MSPPTVSVTDGASEYPWGPTGPPPWPSPCGGCATGRPGSPSGSTRNPTPPLTRGALTPVADDAPDVPRVLRTWCADDVQQELVAEELAAGRLVRVATSDDTTEYELMAESVDALRMQRAAPPLVVPVA